MRTYIKKFENESEYAAFVNSSGFVTPNVSAWEIESGETMVKFNGTKPDIEIPREYVDLGLPSGTLWATENIKDANGNELFFAWGETQGYTSGQVGTDKYFAYEGENSDYKYGIYDENDSENYGMTKYNQTDGKTVLEATDDAATANWGSSWKTPTGEQFYEMLQNTTVLNFEIIDGIQCVTYASTINGNQLTFSYNGYASNGTIENKDMFGYYWTNSCDSYGGASYMMIDGSESYYTNEMRCSGLSVRPIKAQD